MQRDRGEPGIGKIRTFRDLAVWRKSMGLVTRVYQRTQSFPQVEMYGLVSQMRRATVSIASNIAERFGRHSTSEYIHFLQISMGSLFEVETQLEIAQNLGYLEQEQFTGLEKDCRELERMLSALITSLRERRKASNGARRKQ